jgi:hypothetical protein
MDQIKALPIDVLLHHDGITDKGFTEIVDDLETWGEQNFLKGQDTQATHAEGIYDATQIAKMNPPKSCLYPRSQAPWPTMTGWRLRLDKLGLDKYPAMNPLAVIAWQAECRLHLGESYGWTAIGEAVQAGLLSRLPFVGRWIGYKFLQMPSLAKPDCSVWMTERINNFVRNFYRVNTFDLFSGVTLNDGRATPADFPLSQYLEPII